MSYKLSEKAFTSEEIGKIAEGLALQLTTNKEVTLKIRASKAHDDVFFVEIGDEQYRPE